MPISKTLAKSTAKTTFLTYLTSEHGVTTLPEDTSKLIDACVDAILDQVLAGVVNTAVQVSTSTGTGTGVGTIK